jgi:hypothetical protein
MGIVIDPVTALFFVVGLCLWAAAGNSSTPFTLNGLARIMWAIAGVVWFFVTYGDRVILRS